MHFVERIYAQSLFLYSIFLYQDMYEHTTNLILTMASIFVEIA